MPLDGTAAHGPQVVGNARPASQPDTDLDTTHPRHPHIPVSQITTVKQPPRRRADAPELLVTMCKSVAYALSLSSFRGGPVFPAMFIGAAGGVAASHLPGLDIVPAVAMGIGAMSTVMLSLPLTSTMLATLLLGADGLQVMPVVIVAVVVAYVVTAHLTPPKPQEEERTGREVTDDHADDRHEIELADEHLDDRERMPDRGGRGVVAEAGRGEDGEAVVHAVALGRVAALGEERGIADLRGDAHDPREDQAGHDVDRQRPHHHLERDPFQPHEPQQAPDERDHDAERQDGVRREHDGDREHPEGNGDHDEHRDHGEDADPGGADGGAARVTSPRRRAAPRPRSRGRPHGSRPRPSAMITKTSSATIRRNTAP